MELAPNSSFGSSHSGWVTKQSRTLKRWRKRWMVLTSRTMVTYKMRQVLKRPTEDLQVKDLRSIASVESDPLRPFAFKVETNRRTFLFTVDNKEDRDHWVNVIGKAISLPRIIKESGDLPMSDSL